MALYSYLSARVLVHVCTVGLEQGTVTKFMFLRAIS